MNSKDARQFINRMPEVEEPEGLTSAIVTRLHSVKRNRSPNARGHRHGWTILLIGLATGLAIQLYIIFSGKIGFDVLGPTLQRWDVRLFDLSYADPTFYTLAAGLLVYSLGLFILSRK